MKKSVGIGFLITIFLFLRFASAVEETKEPPGKTLFLDNKCNVCHSIKSDGIERKSSASKAPDLSTVGSERTADWIVKFLKKEVDLEGKKHIKAWTGKNEDLTAIAKWLESHKKPAEKK
jgi:mono/diheme cytochrome c family protein